MGKCLKGKSDAEAKDAKFACKKCGAVTADEKHVCAPGAVDKKGGKKKDGDKKGDKKPEKDPAAKLAKAMEKLKKAEKSLAKAKKKVEKAKAKLGKAKD